MPRPIYLDHAATTPLAEEVLAAMMPYLSEAYGNASSVHAMGRRARFAVEESRARIAALIGAEPAEIVFTSGATEANNMAIKGLLGRPGGRLATSPVEHEAVLTPARAIERAGGRVVYAVPSQGGAVTAEAAEAALAQGADLLSLMLVNNETGARSPIEAIAERARDRGVPVHCDAVQAAGHAPLDVARLGVDLMSVSAHKFGGPKGSGFLYVRAGVELAGLVEGGAQERRRRGGTENVAAIVGMAHAFERVRTRMDAERDRLAALRSRLLAGLEDALGQAFVVNTPLKDAAPHILNIAFPPHDGGAMDGEMLLLNLDMEGIYTSSGSACTSGAIEPSHVLLALGLPRATAAAAVRFSLGEQTTGDDVERTVAVVARVVGRMRRA